MRGLGLGLLGVVATIAYKLGPSFTKLGGTTMSRFSAATSCDAFSSDSRLLWEGKDEKDGDCLQIVRMNLQDLSRHHYDWALKENWTPSKGSLEPVYALGREERGFYALNKNGRTIATVSAIEYPNLKTVFVGFFICDKEFRGQGYGKKLWLKVIGDLQKEDYVVSLDCFDHMLPIYQKLGFHKIGYDIVWNYIQEQKQELTELQQEFFSARTLDSNDRATLDAIVAFDAQHLLDSPERKNFLTKWVRKESTQTIVAKDLKGEVVGYGVLSRRLTATKGEFGYRIGPLVVTNESVGLTILNGLKEMAGNEPVFMDTCESHSTAAKLAKQGAFKEVARLNRMSTQAGKEHRVPDADVGLTSLAYSPL